MKIVPILKQRPSRSAMLEKIAALESNIVIAIGGAIAHDPDHDEIDPERNQDHNNRLVQRLRRRLANMTNHLFKLRRR